MDSLNPKICIEFTAKAMEQEPNICMSMLISVLTMRISHQALTHMVCYILVNGLAPLKVSLI